VVESTKLKLKTLPESIFYPESSTVSGFYHNQAIYSSNGGSFYRKGVSHRDTSAVDMSIDSYIIGCCGHRGAGKNLMMSYLGLKAAWLYRKRLLSNYPLGVRIRTTTGRYVVIQSEPLDVARMLEFDSEYDNCVICIQEAPLVINRMAAPTWKNRLLNLWIQEIRHSHSSLIYESQNQYWVDGELQWQTDIIGYMNDASRRYSGEGLSRGGLVLGRFLDRSGMWTGYPYYERAIAHDKKLKAQPLWGTYDTYYKGDIWESLRRVDLKLSKIGIDHRDISGGPTYEDKKQMAAQIISSILNGPDTTIKSKEFYGLIPDLGNDKNRLANELFPAGITRGRLPNGDYILEFSGFDEKKFLSGA